MEKPKDLLTSRRANRAMCLQCMVNQPYEIKACSAVNCPLWYHRFGHEPDLRDPLMDKSKFIGKHNLDATEAVKLIRGDWVKPKREVSQEEREYMANMRQRRKAAIDTLPASFVASSVQAQTSVESTIGIQTVQSGDPPSDDAKKPTKAGKEPQED